MLKSGRFQNAVYFAFLASLREIPIIFFLNLLIDISDFIFNFTVRLGELFGIKQFAFRETSG